MTTLLDLFKTMEYGPAPESPAAAHIKPVRSVTVKHHMRLAHYG